MSHDRPSTQAWCQLRPGLSFAEVGDRLVFLDVAADRYFLLEPHGERALRQIMARDAAAGDNAAPLLHSGLLIPADRPGLVAPCRPPPSPRRSLLDANSAVAGWWVTVRAAGAVQASRARLRWRSLTTNLTMPTGPIIANRATSAERLARVAAAFARAAQWISSQDRCLAQSLAVARAARRAGLSVDVVLGVSLGPFRAHCWVQHGADVVNDRVELVARYTPLLVA